MKKKLFLRVGGGGDARQMTRIFLRMREPGLQRFHRCWLPESEEKSGDGKESDERKRYSWGGRAW